MKIKFPFSIISGTILALSLLVSHPAIGQQIQAIKTFEGSPNDGAYPAGPLTPYSGTFYGTTTIGGISNRGTIFQMNEDGSSAVLYNFLGGTNNATSPYNTLLLDGGVFYGTVRGGGTNGGPAIFKINQDGSGFTILYSFDSSAYTYPYTNVYLNYLYAPGEISSLTLYNYALYGIVSVNGTNSYSNIFKINTDGSGFTNLHSAGIIGSPAGPMILASNNIFYGVTSGGGSRGWGDIFQINPDGSGYVELHSFTGNSNNAPPSIDPTGGQSIDGRLPIGGLIQVGNTLYGTTSGGGISDFGTVFEIGLDGMGYNVLHFFEGSSDGTVPVGGLTFFNGALYGTTEAGGSDNSGTVFQINPDGTGYQSYSLLGNTNGANPLVELTAQDGLLYGTAYNGGTNNDGTVFEFGPPIIGYTILHHFAGYPSDGQNPYCSLTFTNGELYGTCQQGTSTPGTIYDYINAGTIFAIGTNGLGYSTLYNFDDSSTSGAFPQYGALAFASNTLYGATVNGGSAPYNSGTLFSCGLNGDHFNILHSFGSLAHDGTEPFSNPILVNSALYGTTELSTDSPPLAVIYELDLSGGYAILHYFNPTNGDGTSPYSSLVAVSNTLYGTTSGGGIYGQGTIFKINTDGSGYGIVYNFQTNLDGKVPNAPLVADGNVLYGTTTIGGDAGGGTIFKINADGSGYTSLYSFTGSRFVESGDGGYPTGPITVVSNLLYGMTEGGGNSAAGTIYQIHTDGTGYAVVHEFGSLGDDGIHPYGGLTLVGDTFYGTTYEGGNYGNGVIFALNIPGISSGGGSTPPSTGTNAPLGTGSAISNGVVTVTMNTTGYAGNSFSFQRSSNLLSGVWQTIYTTTAGTNGLLSATDTISAPMMFYRFKEN